MADNDVDALEPNEAARIATNVYFTLKDWVHMKPVVGVENRATLENRLFGDGTVGSVPQGKKQPVNNPTLQQTRLSGAHLSTVHAATTGANLLVNRAVNSGFGYTLTYQTSDKKRHVVVATRGTRAEMGNSVNRPDLVTDLHGTYQNMEGIGRVHAGFNKTFQSILPSLSQDRHLIANADVLHFVGHSLGGAVATLLATHYAGLYKDKALKLYTRLAVRVSRATTHMQLSKIE